MRRGVQRALQQSPNTADSGNSQRAPGKSPLTAKLPSGQQRAVQGKLTSSGSGAQSARPAGSPAPRSAPDWLADPLMDAAHRGSSPDRINGPTSSNSPVQARAGADTAEPSDVHRAAASGIESSGGSLPYLSAIQNAFGAHDVSGVVAHIGGAAEAACESMGAAAYATGHNVAFASAPDLHTAAHEAAHVVQQRGGVSLSGGVGQAGDRYEEHADAVADAVVAGRSAEDLLGQVATRNSASGGAGAVQRFNSYEHKAMGDEGTRTAGGQTRTVEVAPNYSLSFGDLTAMSGDYFESVEQIKTHAARPGPGPGTREEIEYVRVVHILGQENRESQYSEQAREAVMNRYYALAGNNSSHFTEPRGKSERSKLNNAGNYRGNHENAIKAAARAGKSGASMDEALLCEGFASHYLTDAYASGHVRTERISISQWWNPIVPMFWTNLKLFIAEQMAWHINDNTTLAGTFQTVQQLWERVRDIIDNKGLPTLSFGDVVSGAVHDYDNIKGVQTQHGLLVGDGEVRDGRGKPIIDPKTGQRVPEAVNTEQKAVAAVRLSMGEVDKAYELGKSHTPDVVVALLLADGQYEAEKIWPRAKPESDQPAGRPRWKQPDVASLVADATMKEAIGIFAAEKAQSLEGALGFEDIEQFGMVVVSASLQAQGFRQRITGPLRANPVEFLTRVIDYTPNTGGGVAGHDTDDNAREYIAMAREQGAMSTLTRKQRYQLIRDLVPGVCGNDDERAIIRVLESASPADMTTVVKQLGGGSAEKGIDYLDSGVDWSEWSELKRVMRRSAELRKHL
ncbi:MAG: DUF4157 domain-containing protein [Proteobacteria bacterium]|nr:DUF4157 domain-containing protein [Pseudomonadota bacterium]